MPAQVADAPQVFLPGLLTQRAAQQPDAIALNVDGTQELRYADWNARSDAAARILAASGAGRGVRVGLLFGGMEWIDYAVAYYGVLKTGATAVHLNADQPAEELNRRIAAAGVAGLVHGPQRTPLTGFAGWTADAAAFNVAESDIATSDGTDGAPTEAAILPEDIADVFFTSGTTGQPKAYAVPHGNAAFGRRIAPAPESGETPHMLTMLQIATGSSASALNIAAVSQVVTVLCPPRDVERMGELIARYRAATVSLTPWVADRMVVGQLHERHDLSTVAMLACGSAPLPAARARALLEMMPGARLITACSQSEASPALVVNTFDPQRPDTVGRPMPGTELRIAGPDGEELPAGEAGEIWLRHSAPKRLYDNRPDLNEPILHEGWYRTGDLGRLDAEGWLELLDRRADVIRTAAGPVYTLAVEAAIYEHPSVVEAAVFGFPDGDGATCQQVAAAVVLDPPQDQSALEAYLSDRLTPHQLPAKLIALDELPRNSQNKVLKRLLRETYG